MGKLGIFIPGATHPQSAIYTVAHDGWGKVVVRLVPQLVAPAANCDIVLSDGAISLTLTDCTLDRTRIVRSDNGWVQQVEYWDRQWRWRFGAINGYYNQRLDDGSIWSATEQTPQQLAILCFEAMRELFPPDVGQLPNNDRPETTWDCEYARPNLAWLCHRSGCAFGLDPFNNQAKIWKLGQGNTLPLGAVRSVDYSADIAELPGSIIACSGKVRFQSKLKLRAMALETDGTYVPLADVSYAPSGGWDGYDPEDPMTSDIAVDNRHRAEQSVYRVWEVASQADDSQTVPGYGDVPGPEYLTLLKELAESYTTTAGTYHTSPVLEGTFAVGGDVQSYENTDDNTVVEDVRFTIDGDRLIVITDTPIYKWNSSLQPTAADLYLVCAYYVKDPDTFQHERHAVSRSVAPNGVGEHVLHRPDIVRTIVAQYSGTTVSGTTDNETTVESDLNLYIDDAILEFQSREALMVEYTGLVPLALDGANRQLSFIVRMDASENDATCKTIVYHNCEAAPGVPRRRERIAHHAAERERGRREKRDRFERDFSKKGIPG